MSTLGGQASYKPRGRKPRHAAVRSGKARPLWGFDGGDAAEPGNRVSRPETAIALMSDGDRARLDSRVR
jgi:hypothetical protein